MKAILTTIGTLVCVFVLSIARVYATDISTSLYISICGDGIVESGEVCDAGAGNNLGGYGSSTAGRRCSPDCLSFGPYCGDHVLQVRFAEECDDGNNVSGDLCSATCKAETPVPPAGIITGSPPVGSIPQIPGAIPGATPADTPTKVVLRGKAYPNSVVSILLDGKKFGSATADSNADFFYTANDVSPGTATFSFSAKDQLGTDSLISSVVFDVIQSAVTTVANVFLPPTLRLSTTQVASGGLLTLSGQSVPSAHVISQMDSHASSTMSSVADTAGNWAFQIDTTSLSSGSHSAKAYFTLTDAIKSGFGRSVSFSVGTGQTPNGEVSSDLNGDGKVNLVDFSIFLTLWGTPGGIADFNQDGKVNLADFSIMLFNWTG